MSWLHRLNRYPALAMAIATISPAASGQVILDATVNADRVGIEDVLELTVEVRGADAGRIPEPTLPELLDFEVAGRSSSSRVSIVNGQMSATKSYIYSLIPRREGTFEIGSAELEISGRVFRSEPIRVEVVAGSVLPRGGRGAPLDPFGAFPGSPFPPRSDRPMTVGDDQVIVVAEADETSVFVGEQLLVTYRLFTKVPIMGVEVDEDPPLSGFWVEEVTLPRNPQTEQTTRNGERWFTVPLKRRVVFPTRPGTFRIPPLTFSMAVRMTSGDPFDSFFARASDPISRSTNPIEIEAKPLPEAGRPSDFTGAVGRFELLEIKEQLERRVRELDVLFEIAQVSASATVLDDLLEGVLARAVHAIEAEAGAILLAEPSGELRFRSAVGGDPDAVKKQKIPAGVGISGWVARHGRPQVVNDVDEDDRHAKEVADRVGYHPRTVLAVPLSWEEGNGALELLNKHGGRAAFTDEDVRTATLIANHISTAISLASSREAKGKQERLSTIGQLLSSVLHDLKTPMTIISGYVQLLAGENDDEERKRLSQSVLRQVELINAMTRETIAFARGDRSVWVRKVYLHKFFASSRSSSSASSRVAT